MNKIHLFGYELSEIRRIIYEYQSRGVDPRRIAELQSEIRDLRESVEVLTEALADRIRR